MIQLAKHEPQEIFLAARTPLKAETAIKEIQSLVPGANVSFLQLDLSSFASVKKAAIEFQSRADRLDILVNNAGIMAVPYSKTTDGYEIQFGTCHMGHALLTKLLMPTLLKTAEEPGSDVRIINVSSIGHNMAPGSGIVYDQDELEKWGTWRRYGQAKLANILHVKELRSRYLSITSTSLHPGFIMTDLYVSANKGSVFTRMGSLIIRHVMPDVREGAKNQLWCAAGNKQDVRSSYYWTPVGHKSSGSSLARNGTLAEELWEYTEKEFARQGY